MRLKKKYMAIIVAAMVILTAVVASSIVGSVQGSRIAYVAVSADKASYSMDENVTFKLKPLSQGVQFTVNGMQSGGGVHIIRLPNGVDPESINTDYELLSNISMWQNGNYGGQGSSSSMVVPIPQFNSTGEALELSWNGTTSAFNRGTNELVWGKVTAGYYVLYPWYSWEYGHSVKFMLDRSSIFYYDGLKVDFNVTTDANNVTITTDLTLPIGSTPISGNFSSFVPYAAYSGEGNFSSGFNNRTVSLMPGVTTTIAFVMPNPGYTPWIFTTSMDASIWTDHGAMVFGFYQYGTYINGQESVFTVQY